MCSVLPNLFCLASYGPPTAFIVFVLVLVVFFGYLDDKARQKRFKEGKIKGVKPSRDFFDWMFYNYRDRQ